VGHWHVALVAPRLWRSLGSPLQASSDPDYTVAVMRAAHPRCHTVRMSLQCIIVDDHQPFLEVARAKLEQQGMAVVGVAANGIEALRQARELGPDLALVDISLGTENGFDVAREINSYVGSVILISSSDHYEDDEYAEIIAGSHAVGFLSKATLSADAISRILL
jgi:DNA-binding NarL/FixJ family response regulator